MKPGARAWPAPDEIVDQFWLQSRRAGPPTQAQLDALIGPMGIPVSALTSSADGIDFPIGMFRVERGRSTFNFSDDDAIKPIPGFVSWGEDGAAEDLTAWCPRTDWLGSWLGRAVLLNAFELAEPRLDGPLHVYLHAADWLRSGREGVLIVDRPRAARLLEGLTIQAVDIAEGLELRKIMERPRARIVVPAAKHDRIAA